ncbi:uroporphyrinogen decarboxylase family protein [Acetohalobium arabaticum]|uniref:Uroporphyrinogen-III decarboxylase n=1 Tax=Acetohalobium arabaticum (strain ATCC 49924 / DSM 5501 / Z-7288) TaxID=574087 RepID=D9QPN5_ACEAZ|nr:uroporphyrinogen decarboxylase family protein [Acetohalobium arabaticum]ADL12476.1 Uroporphyrinogen-III decarboxylase [Acetohalobium arabaticum DSM 5501]
MSELTSRERIIKALEHQETDRIPIDIGGIYNLTTLHRDAYINLMDYLGYDCDEDEAEIAYFNSQSVLIDEEIRQRFKSDCYPLYTSGPGDWELEIHEDEDGRKWYKDEFGIKWQTSGLYYDPVGNPLKDCTVEDIENYPWPDPKDPSRIAGLKKEAKRIYEETDYCLVLSGPLGGGIYVPCTWFIGYQEFFMKLVMEPEIVEALLEKIVDFHLGWWEMVLEEIGEYLQVVVLSDDLGTQEAPLMRPSMYREQIKPAQEKVVSFIKSKADVKVVYHCDGAVSEFIPDMIDIGFDALNPVQVSAEGMGDTARLKEEFGDEISFWGATCDSQNTLSKGTPEEIRQEVKQRVNDLAAGGGLVLASIHNIQKDVPPENIVAFYDALYESACDAY